MPDGMSPEQSIDPYAQFHIGEVAKPVGGEMHQVEQPIAKANLPGSEMQIPESVKSLQSLGPTKVDMANVGMEAKMQAGPNAPKSEVEQKLEAELAAAALRRESVYERMATEGRTPGEVIEGVRKILEPKEEAYIPPEMEDQWQARRVFAAIYERRQKLDVPVDDLINRGWIKNYDRVTGKADILDKNAAAFAVSTNEKIEWVVTEKETIRVGDQVQEVERQTQRINYEYNFGKKDGLKDERKDMARVCERAYLEMGARAITGTTLGVIDAYRDDIEHLTELLQRARYRIPHLKALLNLPDEKEIDKNVEDHTEGNRVEVAAWWYLAMMASEKKSTMKDFLERPATKALVMPGESDEDRTRFLKQQLGDYDRWADDNTRTKDTLFKETQAHLRGPVTKWGNIPARGRGDNFAFTSADEIEFIESIGRLSGSKSSSWSASALLISFQEFSINGVVSFPNSDPKKAPDVVQELGTSNWLRGNDLGKFNVNEFIWKERKKGRPSGPKDIAGKIPRMALSYLDHAQIIVGHDKGVPITYSMRVAWLGDHQRSVVDKATGRTVALPEVPYTRLGALNFDSLTRDDFANNKLLMWLAGREKGIYNKVMNSEPSPEDFSDKALMADRKFFQIGYNPLIALGGDMRGQSDLPGAAEKISTTLLTDLLDAWTHTKSYVLNMVRNIDIYGTGLGSNDQGRKPISLHFLTNKIRERLGLVKGSSFTSENQFIDDPGEIINIPRNEAAHNPFKDIFGK